MAKSAGRDALVKKNGTVIGGVRVSNINLDASPIDITDNDSAGVQTLLSGGASRRSLSFSVEGQEADTVLRDIAMDATAELLLTDMSFIFSGVADVITGAFFMSNYTIGNPYEDATTYTAQFTSSGAWTNTPAV